MTDTLLFAHKGFHSDAPENSLQAFQKAVEAGADGIELDVHLLQDGSLVVLHDSVLGLTVSGKGCIYDMTGDELRTHDFIGFPGQHVPYLSEVLDLLQNATVQINIELKAEDSRSEGIENSVAALLKRYPELEPRLIISSFQHKTIQQIKRLLPHIRIGALYHEFMRADMAADAVKHGYDAIHPDFQLVTAELSAQCKLAGVAVNVWTVDRTDDLARMVKLGVDGIITNNIPLAQETLRMLAFNQNLSQGLS